MVCRKKSTERTLFYTLSDFIESKLRKKRNYRKFNKSEIKTIINISKFLDKTFTEMIQNNCSIQLGNR